MIIAEQKPFEEIKRSIAPAHKVLVVGCGTCVTVCFAGGAREAAILAASLRMAFKLNGDPKEITEVTVQRQCEWEYLDAVAEQVGKAEVVLSLGCGVGVQAIAERFPRTWVVPGLNTSFLGMPAEQGVWVERCAACGDCILGLTAGICPIARCSKSLLNGPCGGSQDGHCEVNADIPCGWQLIYDRLKALGKVEMLYEIRPPKNWRASRDGGPRKIVRPDLRLIEEE
ncbi:MAG: methylenetetrahydrofolate reductase C-terminal domain-containing protein [Anaerolineales bacterium]|nr:methylenetetrahydrofolate reductase C-terminal domain-containing protein [Anaerolineales bacterium]MCS7248226.1 methylenetetrahydrofolate reductase C-terminal domain-containing protein [Anaerolineales bacterium]MDW8162039.1 methylenetetrahydrofolate reductase C-terminal domain-containing protein [Anaerolineales bacterium]MDW8445664.1 methylenetetrahydrofolate reductase C-terminal domain-containing protein [Anaerolineales bacterium]